MEQKANKSAMQNGLIAGALISISFIFGTTNVFLLLLLKHIITIYSLVFLYIATKKYRDSHLNGSMTYFQAFVYVFKVYVFACIIESIVILIYVHLLPKFLPTLMNEIIEIYDKFNPKFVEIYYDYIVFLCKPGVFPIANLFSSTFLALILASIFAAFLKKEKSIFEE